MRSRWWVLLLGAAWVCGCTPEEGDGPETDAAVMAAACANGLDDDGDGLVDLDDPGCTGADDDDESDPVVPACANGEDDDGDGLTDLDDPGCANAADDDETDEVLPQCRNGIDDDDDGAIDLDDPGCESVRDDDESDDPPLPACSNGIDDDDDGLIDAADPGCGSPQDNDEFDMRMPLPQCADEQDNDGDGRVDLADPGCTSAGDPREADPEEAPACFNGLDDDEDGVIDFPAEPGCSAAGDDDEADPPVPPACGNGLDDDQDGRVDFPDDPGCAGTGDNDESDPSRAPGCADAVDNDGDGAIDFPADPGCESAADISERATCGGRRTAIEVAAGVVIRGETRSAPYEHEGTCGGRGAPELAFVYRVDRAIEALEVTVLEETDFPAALYVRRGCADAGSELACAREAGDATGDHVMRFVEPPPGTYYIFLDGAAGRGGTFAMRIDEVPLAACRNGLDDDGDGRIDFPREPGCESREDRDETDPDPLPACGDDLDNDGDGEVDYPLDIGCISAADNDEVDACGQGVRFLEYPVGEPFYDGIIEGGTNAFAGTCGGGGRPERVLLYENPFNARLRFSVDNEVTAQPTILHIRAGDCARAAAEIGCSTGIQPGNKGSLLVERASPGPYYIFVESQLGAGAYRLTVQVERLPPGCSDGVDNDEDGFTDGDDIGCADGLDEDERDPEGIAARPACANGEDDDGDGLIDYPYDPGCATRGADDETDPAEPPQCANGEDDDDDGIVDFPLDPSCSSAADALEEGNDRVACNNRQDDDGDGEIDYPYDPGCAGPGFRSEEDPDPLPACADGLDNDRDGLVDFPFDPGCPAAGHISETDPAEPPACRNGLDDDGDGLADFPRDPGCEVAADLDETDPNFRPQCSDGLDNDANGRIDWPDDAGCISAADSSERDGGRVRVRCSDGLDNDDDGLVDLADPGCADGRDDDEEDLAVVPWCDDGIDNDGDGAIDWPDDDGCLAQGDACEQLGYGLCAGECLDLINDEANCGRCGRVCDPGVECIDGFCGGLFTFEGILENTPDDELGSWEVCHNDRYGNSNTQIAAMTAACDGEFVMYGCRPVGQPNWTLLAMGERDEVFRDTGDRNNVLNEHNGVAWYFSTSTSIGFVEPGTGVSRNSCDTAQVRPERRMCWHTSAGRITSGYRCGATTLNGNNNWERQVWTSR